MGVEHSAQHLSGLIHTMCYVARVVSQHTLLDDAESPRQFFHVIVLLLQELKEFYFKNYLNALYKAVIAEELNDENNTENL